MNKREFPFQLYCFLSCLIFPSLQFCLILQHLFVKKQLILSLCPSLQRPLRDAPSLTCVSFYLENHLSLCLQCIEQGFSHIHVLLKMQYLIQVSLNLFLNQMKIKKEKNLKYMQLWTQWKCLIVGPKDWLTPSSSIESPCDSGQAA